MLRLILTHGNRLDMHGARDGRLRLRWRGQSKVKPDAGNNDTYKSWFEQRFADGLSGYVEQTHVCVCVCVYYFSVWW